MAHQVAAQRLNQYLLKSRASGEALLEPLSAEVEKNLASALMPEQLQQIKSEQFDRPDSLHLEACFLRRDVVKNVTAGMRDDFEKVQALFDWVIRNVQIVGPNEAPSIRVSYRPDQPTGELLFGIAIHDEIGNDIFGANTKLIDVPVPMADGDGQVTFDFEHVPLLDGTYLVTLAIESSDQGTVYDWRDQQYQFSVMNPSRTVGLVSLPLEVRFGTPYAERVEGSGS